MQKRLGHRLVQLLEWVFIWTVGPVVLFFSPQAKVFRRWTLGVGGVIATAWWTGFVVWALGLLVALIPNSWLGPDALNEHERYVLERNLSDSVDEDHPTYQHSMRMEKRVAAWAKAQEVHPAALQAAVLLHDSTLDHPRIPAEQRLCIHGNAAAILGIRSIRQLERNWWYTLVVADAVMRHVGPTGYNWEWQDKRIISKQCTGRIPTPVSAVGKALYDLDMMDKVGVNAAVTLAEQKRNDPALKKKPLPDLLRTDKVSVLKEVADHAQTLQTRLGRACGRQVAKHTSVFLKNLSNADMKDITALRAAATRYLEEKPAPTCLDAPRVEQLESQADLDDVNAPSGAQP